MIPYLSQIPEEITTDRLILRIPRVTDGPAVAAAVQASLAELKLWLPWATDTYVDADGELWCRRSLSRFITGEQIGYSIFDRATGELIGGVGPHQIDWKVQKCEIGYWLRTDRAGAGLMSEAVTAVVVMLDRLKLRRIEIRCDERNLASAAVARRCGFDHEGTLRLDSLDREGVARSSMVFARIMETTPTQPSAQGVQSA